MVNENQSNNQQPRRPTTIGGYHAHAFDLEEQMSSAIYTDYLKREYWPESVSEQTFEKIRTSLLYLLKDTEKHKKMLNELVKEYGPEI